MHAPHRPSILQRPVKSDAGKANAEQADLQFEREQQRLAAKALKAREQESRFIGAFYPSQDEKRSAWAQVQHEAEVLEAARRRAAEEAAQREAAWVSQPQRVVVDMQRPWTAVSSTYYMPPELENEARRQAQREAHELNRAIAQRRAAEEAKLKAAEQQALRRTFQAEDTWLNRGAASERWIAPELRVKHRAGVPLQFAPAPPPYCRDDEPSSSAGCSAASLRPISVRRAQEGQTMAALLRHDAAPVAASGGSFSGRYGGYPSVPAPQAGLARPQTAPPQPQQQQSQQQQHPWSWQA